MNVIIHGLLLALLAGCSSTGTASLKDLPDDWPPLGTPKQEVHTRLGEPASRSIGTENDEQQEKWTYRYEQGETNPLLFVVSGIAVAATGLEKSGEFKVLVLTFNQDGKIISRSMSTEKTGATPAGPTTEYVR